MRLASTLLTLVLLATPAVAASPPRRPDEPYVGFWMHDKSHARRWDAYVRQRLSRAMGRSAAWGLAAVSFLAVYREVFETVLFYQALGLQTAPGGQPALAGGIAVAAVALVSWLIIRGSLRLPLGVFFGATSMILAALAVVLAGKGIAALQEAAVLAHHPVSAPHLPLLGIYPDLTVSCSRSRWSFWSSPDSPRRATACLDRDPVALQRFRISGATVPTTR